MSRQRDYQPTIDRARNQAEIAKAREARIRAKKEECHRDMLRAQNAARIANEEADALRDRIVGLEQSTRDLRKANFHLKQSHDQLAKNLTEANAQLYAMRHPWRRLKARVGERWREMLSTAAEA